MIHDNVHAHVGTGPIETCDGAMHGSIADFSRVARGHQGTVHPTQSLELPPRQRLDPPIDNPACIIAVDAEPNFPESHDLRVYYYYG
mmetsp:Transcript_29277/g.53572  ORF Transcript_29277/g.53572 Transcript_29277/m.53572 type:complete len:87 (-) Transcript_29277:764-1024(-)